MNPILEVTTSSEHQHGNARDADHNGDSGQRIDGEDGGFYSTYPAEPLDTEFKKKYPPDRFGEEASVNARVWKIYHDEATAADKSMLNGWNKTLDILLIFAGLFSAVSTAFIIESYKQLQVDHTEYIANALYLSLTARNATSSIDLAPPGAHFQAPRSARWTNGLWISSLVLSLAVALLSILSKQWLEEYNLRTSSPAETQRHWARRHALLSSALEQWHVSTLISLMPIALHVSLFLFLAGLVIFLFHLDATIMVGVLTFTITLTAFYVLSTILPLVFPACPWATAVTKPAINLWTSALRRLHALSNYVQRRIRRLRGGTVTLRPFWLRMDNRRVRSRFVLDEELDLSSLQ
ncbi:hypothetical protein AURDEDRAFT_160361 [Auricularia subglabra TFB-10046 SS5]|nr:hypothetical protein AURDEDRAFT_160361 [Auricularia subglabra TFB-10046 SS5]